MDQLFDLNKVPFTCRDSSLTIKRQENSFWGFDFNAKTPDAFYIHPVYDDDRYRLHFKIYFKNSKHPLDMDYDFKPERLVLSHGDESVGICYPTRDTMRFCGKTKGFTLDMPDPLKYDCVCPISESKMEINVYTKKAMLYALKGTIAYDAPWYELDERVEYIHINFMPDENGEIDVVWQEYDRAWDGVAASESFEAAVDRRREEFARWVSNSENTDVAEYKGLFSLAQYLLWAYIISDNGYVKDRSVIYISKNWMTASWTYDNLYFMIPLMEKNPELAWDIYLSFVDYQDELGALPDWICSHRVNNRFLKPPCIGSILNFMMDRMELDHKKLEQIYEPLIAQTEFWFKYHDFDGDGIPNYTHGNDGACDNSTIFDVLPTVEGTNLIAFLIAQEYAISRIAKKLGRNGDAAYWERRAKDLTNLFIEHSYDRERGQFVSPMSGSHETASGDSLMDFMPIMLGDWLPEDIFESLIKNLNMPGRFKGKYGYASEGLASPKYRTDSYWRGPVWEHQYMLLVDGLLRAGKRTMAKEVADELIALCVKEGFCENYDVHTGKGQRDLAYTFTAVVFMIFVKEFYS